MYNDHGSQETSDERLQKVTGRDYLSTNDVEILNKEDPPAGVSGAPTENNIMLWNAVIFGPHETPFEVTDSKPFIACPWTQSMCRMEPSN